MHKIGLFEEDMNVQSFKSIIVVILGFSFESSWKKCHLDVALMNSHRGRGVVPLPKGCGLCKTCA
jgi:hypothetical protein